MRIREYTSADFDALRRMHAAQGFGYPLPDLESPLFISKLVLEEDDFDDLYNDAKDDASGREHGGAGSENDSIDGREAPSANSPRENPAPHNSSCRNSRRNNSPRVAMAILQRLTAETYLLHDPAAGTPRRRWQQFLALHEVARYAAAARGLDDVQAFLPPRIARAFGRRLAQLGWARDPWPCFSRRVP